MSKDEKKNKIHLNVGKVELNIFEEMKAALTKEIILSELAARQNELKQYGVQRIGLFGYFARNEATNESDIDLLAEFIAEKKPLPIL